VPGTDSGVRLKLWQKMWLLFAVIWLVVSALNVVTILAFSDEAEWGKAVRPAILTVAVPAVLYLLGLAWQWWKRRSGTEPE
jgi:hypothetical protein